MSLRQTTGNTDDYGRVHTFEIYDDNWASGNTDVKNTGQGYASFSHQKIDPKKPWKNPIQKGVLQLSIWQSDDSLINDLKDADEQQFHVIHKVDGVQEWQGYIYNDLSEWEEGFTSHPYRVTLTAKDFTDLGGKDFLVSSALPDNRETVITTIATLLNEVGFDIPIKTHTSWIEASINSAQDYLRQINHETKALREFGRTGDESDTAITVEDALNKLCSNHKLILKQTGGAYWIDQLSAYDNPASVQETVYDIDGTLNTAETNIDTTVSANTDDLKVVISDDNRDNSGLPGLKRAIVLFNHRTKITQIQFPDLVELDTGTPTDSFSQFFLSDGAQEIELFCRVNANFSVAEESEWRWRIQAGSYYWDHDNQVWDSGSGVITNVLSLSGGTLTTGGGDFIYRGFLSVITEAAPADADGTLEVTFLRASNTTDGNVDTIIRNISFDIINDVTSENSTSIDYQLTQSGNFSVVESYEDDWYGDGPTGYAVSALRHGTADADTTSDSWGRRGQTADKNFHENQLKEPMDLRRGWRRLLTALLKGVYYPHNVLSYDSEFFYYLGGQWDLFTGNFQADLFSLDIVTGTDTFEDLPKFTDEGTGTGSTGGGGGGGLDQSTADARYFKQASLLSEASDLPTLRSNIGLGTGDSPTFAGGTFTGLTTHQGGIDVTGGQLDARSVLTRVERLRFEGAVADQTPARATIYSSDGTGNYGIQDLIIQGRDSTSGDVRIVTGDTPATVAHFKNNGDTDISGLLTAQAGIDVSGVSKFRSRVRFENAVADQTPARPEIYASDGSGSYGNLDLIIQARDSTNGDVRIVTGNTPATVAQFRNNGNTTLTGDLTAVGATFSGDVDVNAHLSANTGSFGTDTLTSGSVLTVSGDMDVSDDLHIGGALMASEFIVEQYRSLTNFQMTPAGGRVESVTGSAGSETVTLEDPRGNTANPFAADDIVLIKFLDTDAAILKEIYRKVASVSGVDVTFTTTGITWTPGTDDVGSIEAGDFLVATGNTSDTTRDHFIRFDITNTPIPSIRFFDTVTDVDDAGNEIVRLGGMDSYDAGITGSLGIAFKTSGGDLLGYFTDSEMKLVGGHSANEFTGVQSGSGTTKAFFAGASDADGTDAKFYAQADGTIFHSAIGGNVLTAEATAAFGVVTSDVSLTDEHWRVEVLVSSGGEEDQTWIFKKGTYRHRAGINTLIWSGFARITTGGTPDGQTNEITITVGGLSQTHTVSNGSFTAFSIELDVSSLTAETDYTIDLSIRARVQDATDTVSTSTRVREDINIEKQT